MLQIIFLNKSDGNKVQFVLQHWKQRLCNVEQKLRFYITVMILNLHNKHLNVQSLRGGSIY